MGSSSTSSTSNSSWVLEAGHNWQMGTPQHAQRSSVRSRHADSPTLCSLPHPAAPGVALLCWAMVFDTAMSLAPLFKAPAAAAHLARLHSSSSFK